MSTIGSLGLALITVKGSDFDAWPEDRSLKLLSEDARSLRRRALKGIGVEIQRTLFVQVARRIDSLGFQYQGGESLHLYDLEAEAWLRLDQLLARADLTMLCSPLTAEKVPIAPTVPPTILTVRVEQQKEGPAPKRGSFLGWVGSLFGRKPATEPPTSPKIKAPSTAPTITPTPVIPPPLLPTLGEQVLFPGAEVEGWANLIGRLQAERLCSYDSTWSALGSERATALLGRVGKFLSIAKAQNGAVARVLYDAVHLQESEDASER